MSRIMIDLDGVVVDFGSGMIPCLQEQGVTTDVNEYYFGAGKEGFRDRMREAIRKQDLFARCRPWLGAIGSLWGLHDAGHDLYVISARIYGRDTEAWSYLQTMRWMQRNGFPPCELFLIEHGTSKVEICDEFDLDFAIDDDPTHFEKLAYGSATMTYLMDRPWNQHVVCDPYRVYSIDEFVKAVR